MRIFAIALITLSLAPLTASLGTGYVYPGDRQWIYCAQEAGACFIICSGYGENCPRPDTMFVFIRANDSLGVERAHFRLEANYPCCDSIQSVVPCPGVTIESGDLSRGMTIAFPLLKSGHFKALALIIWHDSRNPPPPDNPDYGFCVRDSWLERSNNETVALSDNCTEPFYPDCFWDWVLWYRPDTIDVFVGRRNDVRVDWAVNGPYYFGYYVTIADQRGWVHDYAPNGVEWTGCLTCDWGMETTHIYVEVPADVPKGTLSTVTISNTNEKQLDKFTIRAEPPVATQKQSWGTVKSLFK